MMYFSYQTKCLINLKVEKACYVIACTCNKVTGGGGDQALPYSCHSPLARRGCNVMHSVVSYRGTSK